jgi:hypothetical protein
VLRPWHLDFGPWTLADPCVGFALDGIPITLDLPVSAGLAMEAGIYGETRTGVCAEGSWGWTGNLGARWSWRGVQVLAPPPRAQAAVTCRPLDGESLQLKGEGSLKPSLQAAPRLGIAALVFGSCPGTLALEARCTLDPATGNTHFQLDVQAGLEAGLDLDVPLLGNVWSQRWPLRSWTLELGSRDLPAPVQASLSQSPLR